MRRTTACTMAFLLALGLALPAQAAEIAPIIRPAYQPDGTFGFCMGEQTFADGRKLSFALSTGKELNIGVTIPKAGLRKDQHYDIGLGLDDAPERIVRTRALSEDSLLLQMGGARAFQESLRTAQTMKLGAGQKKIAFALPVMDQMMRTLDLCVADNLGKRFEDAKAATEKKQPETKPQPSQNQETTKALPHNFPPSIYNLLMAANLGPITILSMEEVPQEDRPADFIWQTGDILGGVREVTAPSDQSLTDLIGLHINGLKKKCNGAFKTNVKRETSAGDMRIRRAEAFCTPTGREKKKAISVGLVFYLTKDHIFSVLTHEGFADKQDEVLAARDQIAQTLLNAARKTAAK